jgi:putative aminopeptidase FrvX
MNFSLLKKLCSIHAPSGNESLLTSFLLDYINENKSSWKVAPVIYSGRDFQDCIVLVFGNPTTAMYAHIDNIGFTARYNNNLVKVGGPKITDGMMIKGADKSGIIECSISFNEETNEVKANFNRTIETGTDFSFKSDFREDGEHIQSCYLDNRLGVWVALNVAETLENGAIVFTCWEEHGGGTAGYLSGFLYQEFKVQQALICDITWITEGVSHGNGVVISLRDSGIPRKSFVNKIRTLLEQSSIPFQLEVESSGGSDGNDIQKSPFPIDWCFIGAAEDFVHSPDEKVHKKDIQSMVDAYSLLMEKL